MKRMKLLDEFVMFCIIEPIFAVLLGLFGCVVFLIRAFWTVLVAFFFLGWVAETIIALIAWEWRGLWFWFYFGAGFLAVLMARRIAAFPIKLVCDWALEGRFSSARRRKLRGKGLLDETFDTRADDKPVIKFASARHP